MDHRAVYMVRFRLRFIYRYQGAVWDIVTLSLSHHVNSYTESHTTCCTIAFVIVLYEKPVKARSHGVIFLFVTAMQIMECVDVNGSVHVVRFHVCAMHWCVQHCTRLGCTPILCDCDV